MLYLKKLDQWFNLVKFDFKTNLIEAQDGSLGVLVD